MKNTIEYKGYKYTLIDTYKGYGLYESDTYGEEDMKVFDKNNKFVISLSGMNYWLEELKEEGVL